MYKLLFKPNWDKYFKKFNKETQQKIIKKFQQMKSLETGRGLKKSKYQVEEVGQYRIAFIVDFKKQIKFIHFVGNHKQYEKRYKHI